MSRMHEIVMLFMRIGEAAVYDLPLVGAERPVNYIACRLDRKL